MARDQHVNVSLTPNELARLDVLVEQRRAIILGAAPALANKVGRGTVLYDLVRKAIDDVPAPSSVRRGFCAGGKAGTKIGTVVEDVGHGMEPAKKLEGL